MSVETGMWEDLKEHDDYEIYSEFPYQIRKKTTGKILKETLKDNGYLMVSLNGKKYYKHRLIATQWIENDEPGLKFQIDHKNHVRTDNRIENLRWVPPSENCQNRSINDASFVDELPESAITVDRYGKHENLNDLYYCDDVFYVYTGINYRMLNKLQNSKGYYFIDVKLLDGPRLKIYYSKFKREYNLE